jgi:hypothetical protein
VVGIQVCGGDRYDAIILRGLQVFDVTDPASPVELRRLSTGFCTRGLHELEVQHRADLGRTFVYASVPASEYPDEDSPTGVRDQHDPPPGDFRLLEVTNPSKPAAVSDWGVVKDMGGPLGPRVRRAMTRTRTGTAIPRTTTWGANCSEGIRVVDASDPTDPTEVAWFVPPAAKNPIQPSQRGSSRT